MTQHKIILLNKPIKITSNKIIQIIKKKLKIQKIGHCGTLDPSATGLLIICITTNTSIIKNIILYSKTYILLALIGIKTLTSDLDGKITFFQKAKKNVKNIKILIKNTKYIKTQIPTIFSSIKHNKINLYKFARLEINIKPKKKEIKIYKIMLIKHMQNLLIFKIKCSHGVYIRSILDYFSEKIKKPICTIKIQRISIKNFNIINSHNIKKLYH